MGHNGGMEWISTHFGLVQGLILTGILLGARVLFFPSRKSQFGKREAELKRNLSKQKGHDDLGRSKLNPPLQLPGIDLTGRPHEILGISPQATEKEIQTAYRNLMKQYHPDRVATPGSEQWQSAQKIAAAITQARDSLMK